MLDLEILAKCYEPNYKSSKVFFECLEFGTTLCDVDYLEGEK